MARKMNLCDGVKGDKKRKAGAEHKNESAANQPVKKEEKASGGSKGLLFVIIGILLVAALIFGAFMLATNISEGGLPGAVMHAL